MTDIEPVTELETTPQGHLSALGRWALDAHQAHQVAKSLARTAFVPEAMRGKPDEITAAILTGAEIGLDPMSSLRSIDLISGTPAMRAHALRGLVQSRGHKVWVEESTDTRAVVCGQRRGDDQIQRSVWTLERAKKMDLLGKSNWRRMPQAMLIARASSECCRLIASDVLLGMPYSTEELDDLDDATPEPPQRKAPARKARRAEVTEAPAPELEPAPEPVAKPDETEPEEPTFDDVTEQAGEAKP